MKKTTWLYSLFASAVCGFSVSSYAQTITTTPIETGTVRNVLRHPENLPLFELTPFLNNYVLPYYFTDKPNQAYYEPQNPNNSPVSDVNIQFQLSFKYGLAKNLFSDNDRLSFAYTQRSDWQAYDSSAYFRDSEYQPEVFLTFFRNTPLSDGWVYRSATFGLEHQSNGKGGKYERSWNRAYADFVLTHGMWTVSIKPWLRTVIPGSTDYNPKIMRYMGYGRVAINYQFGQNIIGLELRNVLESGFSRGYEQLTWNFPIHKRLHGYLKVQSGYGFTVSDFDHYDNAIGVGFVFL